MRNTLPRYNLKDVSPERRREIAKKAAATRARQNPGAVRKKELKGSRKRIVEETSDQFKNALGREGISYTDLSHRLKMTTGHISHLMSGTRNMTLITMADIGDAIGYDVTVILSPKTDDR